MLTGTFFGPEELPQLLRSLNVLRATLEPGNSLEKSSDVSGPERCPATLRTGSVIRMSPRRSVNLSLTSAGVLAFLRYSSVMRLLAGEG